MSIFEPNPECGIIINEVKYLPLSHSSLLLKSSKKSLHDTIYCILRDIFRNADTLNICNQVNTFNSRLMKGIPCDENPDTFDMSDALHDKIYMKNLIKWLDNFKAYHLSTFENVKEEDVYKIDMTGYKRFDEWWAEFEEIKRQVKAQYENIQ